MLGKYLIINAGSSSLKFSLYDMPSEQEVVNGYVEKIGNDDSYYTLAYNINKIDINELKSIIDRRYNETLPKRKSIFIDTPEEKNLMKIYQLKNMILILF